MPINKKNELIEKARKEKARLSAKEESEFVEDLDFLTITYGSEFVKGKWQELENKILSLKKDWKDCYGHKLDKYISEYATEVLGKRWEEAEKLLLKFSPSLYQINYAKKFIGRWKELEEAIINNRASKSTADGYAIRGESAEDVVLVGVEYSEKVIKGRWPELEKKLLSQDRTYYLHHYVKNIVKGRWPELENKLIKSRDASSCLFYIKLTKERISELEEIVTKDRYAKYTYKNYIKKEIEKLLKKKNYEGILKYCDYEEYPSIIKNFYKKYFIPDVLRNSILAQSLVGDKESLKALNEDKIFKNKVKSLIEELINNGVLSASSSVAEIIRIIS